MKKIEELLLRLLKELKLCNPTKYMTEEERTVWRQKISSTVKQTMSSFNTKELCNPMKGRTEEQVKLWRQRISLGGIRGAKSAWSNPESRAKMMATRQNRVWVHKGECRKFIKRETLQQYLDMGYSLGQKDKEGR